MAFVIDVVMLILCIIEPKTKRCSFLATGKLNAMANETTGLFRCGGPWLWNEGVRSQEAELEENRFFTELRLSTINDNTPRAVP